MRYSILPRIKVLFALILTGRIRRKLMSPLLLEMFPTTPILCDVGLPHGPSVGSRYDLSELVDLKLQYGYTALRHDQAIHALALQASFTF